MPQLILAMDGQLLTLDQTDGRWTASAGLPNSQPQCLAADTLAPGRFYCGTFGQGLWVTDDSGKTWRPTGAETIGPQVTSVAVSTNERRGGLGVVYAGTEPSRLYRSEDGGTTWQVPADITKLPSSKAWSFPPRPETHHVRYIEVDPIRSGRLYLAIEAGALIRSFDGGRTWKDRVESGPYDTHTLATTSSAPGRLYSAAGDGYFESVDYGESWRLLDKRLRHHYLYSVAVQASDPDTVLVSASQGPWSAYNPRNAESYIYRKEASRDWKLVTDGLPPPHSTTVSVLEANPHVAGEFYAANNAGVYRSTDAGLTWEKQAIPWPRDYTTRPVWNMTVT